MARLINLWQKKRGDRRTGSKLIGGMGEALFFGVLFFFGAVSLAALITTQAIAPETALYKPGYGFWLMVIVLSSFVLIGGGGGFYAVLQVGASSERRAALARKAANINPLADAEFSSNKFPNIPSDSNLTNSPGITFAYRLPAKQLSTWKLAAATAFCMIWNVVAAVLLVVAIQSHRLGQPEWFLTIFLIPFLGGGVWTIYYFVKQLRLFSLVGPTSVEISDHPLHPGSNYEVFVSQAGRQKLKWLELSLVCEEEATFHQGTDIRVETREIYRHSIIRSEAVKIEPGSPYKHECRFQIPEGAMHSFLSNHNAINWKLEVRGDPQSWPVYERDFPLIVFPNKNGEGRI